MKKILGVLFLLSLSNLVTAQQDGFGIGLIVGEPTGISFKKFIGGNKAVDGAMAWSFRRPESFHIHADLLWHNYDLLQVNTGKMALYYGVGGRLRFAEDPQLGLRIPVGLTYLFDGAPFDVFLEVVPILDLIPATDVEFNGALGGRFYF